MRTRSLAIAATLTLVSLAVALAVRSGEAPAGGARAPLREMAPTAQPSPPPVDPDRLRDIFRFADDEAEPESPAAPVIIEREATPGASAMAASGPRLVGLVWRSSRLFAVFVVDDQVVLVAPGESVAGVTIVSVDDESVRIRRGDGSESTLGLP